MIRTTTETLMIASDLKAAGFGTQVMEGYNTVRVFLTRKLGASPWSVRRALEQAGYEDCQFTLNSAAQAVYVRAVGPE